MKSCGSRILISDQVDETAVKQEVYLDILTKLEEQQMSCADVDWAELTHQNFWSIKPHLTAQTCYEQMGVQASAEYHAAVVEFLLTGILSNGNGENYYSAFEVATWGDAHDVLDLAGFTIVDAYLKLTHQGQGLFYIVVADDPNSGKQREIYFDNNKFLHQVMGYPIPFRRYRKPIRKYYSGLVFRD